MTLTAVEEIARRLNNMAESLAPKLLPHGYRSGNCWMASGIADTGKSSSLYLYLAGNRVGHWIDAGNARAGEEHGDMLDLLRLKRGYASAAEAIAEAKTILGIRDEPRTRQRVTEAERLSREEELRRMAEHCRKEAEARQQREADELVLRIKRAKALFLSGDPIKGTPAEWYLRQRYLEPVTVGGDEAASWPGSLRFHRDVWCSGERCKIKAMLAGFYTHEGKLVACHRTFLMLAEGRGWTKIDSPNPKTILGPYFGAFCPINKGSSGKSMRDMPEGEIVYVCEGIEDALTVRMVRPNFRIVCAGTLPNIGGLVLPPQAKTLAIVADRDPSEQAQYQLERAIGRQQARGVTVKITYPAEGFKDFNEWHCHLMRERQRAEKRGNGSETR